jgi:2-polyprenyl-3-methyl-5-hydroxy-6-metoxy-1,4-benzoquinol methylase
LQKDLNDDARFRYIEKKDPWSSHAIIQKWLRGFGPGTRVLDIGTASGMLGRSCSEAGFYIIGIEPVKELAEIANPFYDEFLCSSLEQAPDEFIACQDIVVCGDVLEHLPDPGFILNKLVKLQKPDTQFFISVPNVANIWIRINLLLGKFNYTENGILDRSHLRFFTKSTFIELINASGLKVVEMIFSPIPLTRIHPFFQNNWFGRFIHRELALLSNLIPNLFAYQFVARLRIIDKRKENET